MTLDKIAFSRPSATALSLGDQATDSHRFPDKHVLLTGESEIVSTRNGRECILASLRLLFRICSNITVSLPPENQALLSECKALASSLTFGKPILFQTAPNYNNYDAILAVGYTSRQDLPYTVINSNGWMARVSSGHSNLPSDCSQFNPIASLASASMGVAEIFKRLIGLKPTRGDLLDATIFSLFNYQAAEGDLGLTLPESIPIDLLVAGAGAIGNGVIYLLSRLPVKGRVIIVDKQEFNRENLGTSLLVGPDHIGKDKAKVAASFLNPKVEAVGYRQELSAFSKRLGTEIAFPRMAVGCLDKIEPRHELQRLWLDTTIDGAIGDFGCQVSSHIWGKSGACLLCLFRPPNGELAEDVASRLIGIDRERCKQELDVITEDDILSAETTKRDWLRGHIGHQICSVIQEATAQAMSDKRQRPGFQPSVPFVATLSASMVVGEIVKHAMGWTSQLDTRFQMDVLRGPSFGQMVPQDGRKDCECMTRRKNIERVRNQRIINR